MCVGGVGGGGGACGVVVGSQGQKREWPVSAVESSRPHHPGRISMTPAL